jgi:hypothetical protein
LSSDIIAESRIRQLAVQYYAALLLWPVYLFLLPAVCAHAAWLGAVYLVFPGVYLFTWVGYLMHESWHKYVPNVNHGFFFNALGLLILSDPQLYHLVHGSHHSQVHTFGDAEFHPLGEIRNRALRIVYNWLEFGLGVAFLIIVASLSVPRDPRFAAKYRWWKLPLSMLGWTLYLGGIGFLSRLAFGVTLAQIASSYVLTFWLNSFVLHQSQLIEHGNLIVEGTFTQRNVRTRNLKAAGLAERVVLFFTHNDSREHVLHHTLTKVHSRPFPGVVPLPPGAEQITLRDYAAIAGRMLCGRVDQMPPR